MHRDAPSCTVMHRDSFISSIITFELHQVPLKWFFFLLYLVPTCTVMHWDAPWCTEMHRDATRWLYFFYNIFWIAPSATKLIFVALVSSYLHSDATRCTVMHPDGFISSIISSELHRVPPKWFFLLYLVPTCTVTHRDAPWCTEKTLEEIKAISVHHFASWCITVQIETK